MNVKSAFKRANAVDTFSLQKDTYRFGRIFGAILLVEYFILANSPTDDTGLMVVLLIILVFLPLDLILWVLNLTNFFMLVKNKRIVPGSLLYWSLAFTFIMPCIFLFLLRNH